MAKKGNFKKFYQNNRIYCILMMVSAICLIIILTSIIIYFIGQTTTSVYGHRLEDIGDYPVENEVNELKSYFEASDKVESVNTDLRGKIIYVNLKVKADLANEDIQAICTESLTKLTEEQKTYYDIQFIVKRDDLRPYLGSKSASQKIIAWANYSYTDEEEEEVEEGE